MQLRGYYRPGDSTAMHRLDLKCFTPIFQFDLETMRQAAEDDRAIVVVVERGAHKEMTGFIIVHLLNSSPRKDAYVVTLDVAPESRRSGIATLMLDHAEQQARAAGASRMALHVAVDNAPAIQFYERQKYIKSGLAKRFYREVGLDAFVYAKQLDKSAPR